VAVAIVGAAAAEAVTGTAVAGAIPAALAATVALLLEVMFDSLLSIFRFFVVHLIYILVFHPIVFVSVKGNSWLSISYKA
jgi:hypothetical protein